MIERQTPILIWILAASDKDLVQLRPVTRMDIMDGASLDPHPDGLFSTEIFGPFGNEIRDKLYGKIDLKVHVMHPKVYRDLLSLKGQYKNIVDGRTYAVFNKKIGDFETAEDDDVNGRTGYGFFMDHVMDLKLEKNQSIKRSEAIDNVLKWRHKSMMKNLVVLPAGLRDIEVSGDGRITKNDINDLYYRVLTSTSVIIPTSNMDGTEYDSIRRNLQNAVGAIYEYIEGLVGGKRGYMREKFISRRVMDGTRNVITAMDATGVSLHSLNVPGFDSTVLGLHQSSRALAPKVVHWMLEGPLRKLRTVGDSQVELVDPKSLKRTWVNIDPDILDEYVSENGLKGLIDRQKNIAARHRAIVIDGYYLALVYQDDKYFKILDSIDDLPADRAALIKASKATLTPITLREVIYYSMYDKVNKHFNMGIRYPGTDDNSSYPTRYYVKTSTTAKELIELDINWEVALDDKGAPKVAPEWPMLGIHTYHDSHSPSSSRLGWSQADFDGDTMSSTGIMTKTANQELENYSKTRNAWITPDGQMRASIHYDTSIMMFMNLTGRYDHVKSLDKNSKSKLLSFI